MDSLEKRRNSNSIALKDVKYLPINDEDSKDTIAKTKSDSIFLYYTILSATLLALAGGTGMAWTSPVIPKLESNDTNINPLGKPASTIQISMMVGIPLLVGMMGALIGPLISDVIGRKPTFQLLGLGTFVCNLTIAFSHSIILITIARSLFFAFFVAVVSTVPIYVTEVCEKQNRAKFACMFGLFVQLGDLFSFLFGPMFTFKVFTLLCNVPSLMFLILFSFTYETPAYLLSKGKKDECIKVLLKLRNHKNIKEIQMELSEIENTLKISRQEENVRIISLFKTKQGQVGICLAFIPMFFHFSSGSPTLVSYLQPIFNTTDNIMSGDTISILVGIVKVCSFVIAILVVERMGRRPLLLFSLVGCAFSLFIVGIFFYLTYIGMVMNVYIQVLPVIGIIVFFMAFSMGLGPLPHTIIGELFTSDLRSVASSFLFTILGVVPFVLSTCFPLVAQYAGIHWCIWFLSFNCLLGAILIYLYLPETGGKSISEIQEIIKNYRFNLKFPVNK